MTLTSMLRRGSLIDRHRVNHWKGACGTGRDRGGHSWPWEWVSVQRQAFAAAVGPLPRPSPSPGPRKGIGRRVRTNIFALLGPDIYSTQVSSSLGATFLIETANDSKHHDESGRDTHFAGQIRAGIRCDSDGVTEANYRRGLGGDGRITTEPGRPDSRHCITNEKGARRAWAHALVIVQNIISVAIVPTSDRLRHLHFTPWHP